MTDDPISILELRTELLERLPADSFGIIALGVIAVAFIAYLVLPRDGLGGFSGRLFFGVITLGAVVVLAWRLTVIGMEIQVDHAAPAAQASESG